MMIALLILAVSVTALGQFAICQWRSMWITVAAQPLSDCLQSAVGLAAEQINSNHFELLARTSEQMCPATQKQDVWLGEVRVYFRIVAVLNRFAEKHLPALSEWSETELVACARYAAAVLDQRLNANLAFASEMRNY
jgi:hypothetical protein